MATFSYIAKRSDGSETRGVINAATPDAAREELRKRGLLIEDVQETKPVQPANSPRPSQQQPRPVQPSRPVQPQRPVQAKPVQPQQQKPAAPAQIIAQKPVAKVAPLPWSASSNAAPVKKPSSESDTYAPLHETLRIFAGWLLAWYGLIYALGFLEHGGGLPPIPFVHELFISPLVLQFTFGTFLLLALSNIHRWIGRGMLTGFVLAIVYVGLVAGFVVYG